MDVYVDDKRREVEWKTAETLGDVVEQMKDRVAKAGRIIVGVMCDGVDITGDQYEQSLTKSVNAFARVDLYSAEPKELVREGLARAGELLDAAAAESTAIVDGFARGDVRTALPKLGECCQTWSQVHLAICNSVSMLHLDPSRLEVDGRPLVETLRVPFDHLQHIKKVLEDRDFVLLSDILTYEFPEALAAWRKTIEALTAAAV